MSYLKDLDEYTYKELFQEIERRLVLVEKGLCYYCGCDPTTTSPCKFVGRHRLIDRIVEKRKQVEGIA